MLRTFQMPLVLSLVTVSKRKYVHEVLVKPLVQVRLVLSSLDPQEALTLWFSSDVLCSLGLPALEAFRHILV